ncbi:MAG: tyrosine--tRNA ligase [Jatrophihabitantaceae bacterium]
MDIADLPAHLKDAHEVLASGAAQILPGDGLAERLLASEQQARPLRVKLGIDPSGADLTLGHAVVLRKLRQFQDFGHTAVLVVGGFTGQVGDPSDRTSTRSARSVDEVVQNAKGYFEQLMRILDPDRAEVVNNADWLAPMQVGEMLGYTRQLTIAQLLERDDFARRFKANQPISLSEFFYPLLQGIDSVAVHADIELGGTDQTFNNLVGRELQRSRGQNPQTVLTMPLLVGTDGVEKMGKSVDNYIGIDEPPAEQFGKLMSIPDGVVGPYARLCTALHPREIEALEAEVAAGGGAANRAKRRMAR